MLEPAMFLGLGAVAVWTHLRFPRIRPGSLIRAAVHVALSFGAFALLPIALGFLVPLASSHAQALGIGLTALFPTLTYLLLSWVWLVARILHELGGTPRGGLPATGKNA
ncbi:MAG TPA: hypothetical protein VHZ77_05575 [Gaiellaceae bacterium]|jgi:hypothetical protein|nr:hypothetical protein [Gaiellaceae bacterium]